LIVRVCILALALAAASLTHAATWDLSVDLRAANSNGRDSYLDRGQGKLRYGDGDSGVHLDRLRAAWDQPLGDVFASHIEASSWGDEDRNPIDFTEAYIEYRPYPRAGFRSRVRLGMFYPPMSLENRATGWETPYTLTPSAISSWIGEEVRTIGLEGQVDWLGTRTGHAFDLQLTTALFGWNDPAGAMIATHGFVFSDRQTTLFGRSGEPRAPDLTKQELFHEIDNRAGYYVGGQVRYFDRAVLNILHYDNRGDPTVFRPVLRDFAWDTNFDAAGLRVETSDGWTALVQWLDGCTAIAPPGMFLEWDFDSRSALLAKRIGPHMLTARYDHFEVEFSAAPFGARPTDPGNEHGHAWTAAYSYDRGKQWRFVLEWLRVTSSVTARPVLLQEPALASETKVELSARYTLSGSF
jgi:hypothetical protein